ncbi:MULTISPECIES: MFS transporter [unclassified Pseudomonas]|uniref:MFS transporter n=1 Tax=unclassified Pseudomonas TaxID=196821 RepID=UPI0013148C83|nr:MULTISPECIES: MFS transporter [unclassified Pseudomonas]
MHSTLADQATIEKSAMLSSRLMWFMSTCAGIGIANLYYNQPLLALIRNTFKVTEREIGWVPTLTQIGYALGMMFLIPLGDMFERKRLIVLFSALGAVTALGTALAPSLYVLLPASFLYGLTTMTPQLLVPLAIHLSGNEQRGRVVGVMISGILMGILVARVISGFLGDWFGWRAMFTVAAALMTLTTLVMYWALPGTQPTYHGSYVGLLKSVVQLFRTQPVLRESCLFGAMLFGSFMAFWSSLIYLFRSPTLNLGPREVGLYALIGAVAALFSPPIGALTERIRPRRVTGAMIGIALASYGIIYLGQYNLLLLAIGVLIMDLGVQLGHVANQRRVFGLVPDGQSRVQTVYMFCFFIGAGAGSAAGSWAWTQFQWEGVCSVAALMLGVAALRWLAPDPAQRS